MKLPIFRKILEQNILKIFEQIILKIFERKNSETWPLMRLRISLSNYRIKDIVHQRITIWILTIDSLLIRLEG